MVGYKRILLVENNPANHSTYTCKSGRQYLQLKCSFAEYINVIPCHIILYC